MAPPGRRSARGAAGVKPQPIYYEYGNNVSYQGDQVYYGEQPVASAEQYYQQAATIAQSAPAAESKPDAWLPLGVFSLVQGSQTDSATIFQLAINKSGEIGGNYYSPLADTTLPVKGFVDKKDAACRLDGGSEQVECLRDRNQQPVAGRSPGARALRKGSNPTMDARAAEAARENRAGMTCGEEHFWCVAG